MNILLEKQELKQLIDSIQDESLILFLKKMVGRIKETRHIPLTREELITRALEAEKAIDEKRYISIDELENEMKNW